MKRVSLLVLYLYCSACSIAPSREFGEEPGRPTDLKMSLQERMPSGQDSAKPLQTQVARSRSDIPRSELMDRFNEAKNAEDMERLIDRAEKEFDRLSEADKIVACELLLMKAFKSYRSIFVTPRAGAPIPFDPLFSAFTGFEFQQWPRTPQVDAYFSAPVAEQFKARTEGHLMSYLANRTLFLEDIVRRLDGLKDSNNHYPAIFCQFGCEPGQKYATRLAALADVSRAISRISITASYSNNGLYEMLPVVAHPLLTGDAYLKGPADAIRAEKYARFWTLTVHGKEWMQKSYRWLVASIRYRLANKEYKKREAGLGTPEFSKVSKEMEDLRSEFNWLGGNRDIRIGNNSFVKFDFVRFYRDPPADLKKFLPTGFSAKSGMPAVWLLQKPDTEEPEAVRLYFETTDNQSTAVKMKAVRAIWPGGAPVPLNSLFNTEVARPAGTR